MDMKLLHELVMDYALASPEKPAAEDMRGIISYRELNARSASLSAALSALGVQAGDAVAVYVPYTKEIILGAVSAIRAGGIYVPFDAAYPAKRLEYMLNDCQAKAVLTVRELWERKKLDFPENRIIFMDEDIRLESQPFRTPALQESSPCMLLYTSGTTGKPKGVLHSHGFLNHMADWINIHEGAEMNTDTRSGVMSAFPFLGSTMFLLGPLARGGTVCIAPETAGKDLHSLWQFLKQARITHIFVPSGLAVFLAEDYDVSGIWIFAGGDKLRSFHPHVPGNFLINIYGSTESGVVLSKRIFGNESQITVGKPSDSTKAQLVDETLRPVPDGEIGELLTSRSFMARRYFRSPESGVEKWIEIDDVPWFRTGDRARVNPAGEYEILGRMDSMIKLRGFRIETGEVETQIAAAVARIDSSFTGMFVVVKKMVGGTEHLCCYYESKRELNKAAIIREISGYLAEYMVPDIWVRMDALPRNVNGKVMRNELPLPEMERNTFGALDSEVLARLVWTAAEVLELNELISPEDSFITLGGTSLTAMVYVSRLREQGIRISSSRVLRGDSFRKLADTADVIWEQLWTPDEYMAVRNSFAERGERIQKVLPVSVRQDELLFDQILHPDWIDYKNVIVLQFDSIIAQSHLREALDILSAENGELRSAIVYHGVTTVQQVITDRKIPLEIYESASFGQEEMVDLRNRILYTPMDLQYSSLMRVIAVHAAHETFLYVLTHRIAFSLEKRRTYLARIMSLLEGWYPGDISIHSWREILEEALSAEQREKRAHDKKMAAPDVGAVPPEICIYSENNGPRLVFVHTGNTGSEAYYRLAARIRDQVSFAVIEPFNLYHPDQARYGISQIAAGYIETLKKYQPHGPYLLGGWCYGGVVAHEMACQLEQAGEEVRRLFLLDAHAMGHPDLVTLSEGMYAEINRKYFETCPLFAELRADGMLDAMVTNAAHVSEDLMAHVPSFFHGPVTYFKPMQIPAGVSEDSRRYWQTMMEFSAGNYERYCPVEKLKIVPTPHEHDLMMDDPSLDIIVPEIYRDLGIPFGTVSREALET